MYKNLIILINWLIKIANKIRLVKCACDHECLCDFCSKADCNYHTKIDRIIGD